MGGIFDSLGGRIVSIVVLGALAVALYTAFSKTNVASMEQDLILLRMQAQQFYFGSDYDGFSNEVAVKAGIVPKSLMRGDRILNPWGGDVQLSSNPQEATFTIEVDDIPQDACIQLARFQPDAWTAIAVNGGAIDPYDVMAITDACGQATNSLSFSAH